MDFIYDLIGRFHPLFVHLPIGFIIIGLMLDFFFRNKKEHLPVLSFIFLWAFITSIFSIITGYLQYDREGYAWESVQWHLVMGIVTMIFCLLFYLNLKYVDFKILPKNLLSASLGLSLLVTGHLGGNITHGSDHLIEPLPNKIKGLLGFELKDNIIEIDPKNYQNVVLYKDVIQPILNQKCVSCHNDKKTKGGLKMNNYDAIMKGGKNGAIVMVNNSVESKMHNRMTLPMEDRYHMPPKSRIQLSREEIELIKIWIDNSASKNALVGDLPIPMKIISTFFPDKPNGIFPETDIEPVNNIQLSNLRDRGFLVVNIFESSPFIKISCINISDFNDKSIEQLVSVKNNIVELDLSYTKITDNVFEYIKDFKNLTVLKLDNTNVSGEKLNILSGLSNLKKISLVNTPFDLKYIYYFYKYPKLSNVNLFKSGKQNIDKILIPDSLKNIFNLGDLKLEKLSSDDIVYPFKVYGE
tara:strand:+ start:478 stop:1881 length:1404 start_codon:yes stop_codon:yes gene_type:complete